MLAETNAVRTNKAVPNKSGFQPEGSIMPAAARALKGSGRKAGYG